jgi:putative DNA primase/helicase
MSDVAHKKVDIQAVKDAARGRWPEILKSLGGLSDRQLKDFHQPCPVCGGTDRFRFDNQKGEGTFFCSQHGSGDGFKLLEDRTGKPFIEVAKMVAEYLGRGMVEGYLPPALPPEAIEPEDEKPKNIPIFPVPEGTADPDFIFFHRKFDTKLKAVAHWAYRDPEGRLLHYACRFLLPDGNKDVLPLCFCDTPKGRRAWRWVGAPSPRPLYNWPRLAANPTANVLVVEGEKKADAAQRMIDAAGLNVVVTSWSGGCKSRHLANWSLLQGRWVAIWPDNDQEGLDAAHGVLNPRGRWKPGVAQLVEAAGAKGARVVDLAALGTKPEAWDLADAEAEGWDGAKVMAYIKANAKGAHTPDGISNPAEDAYIDRPEPAPAAPAEPSADPAADNDNLPPLEAYNDNAPDIEPQSAWQASSLESQVRPLGYDGDLFFYYSAEKRQVTSLTAAKHTELNLLSLAPEQWWRLNFPTKSERQRFNTATAADWLMRACYLRGVYDPDNVRGRGAWWDDGRTVVHMGDRLVVEGIETQLHAYESRFLYPANRRMNGPRGEPLTSAEARTIIDAAKLVRWEMPASAALLSGWIAIAPICGALRWRPHIWVTGGAGSGKSTLTSLFIQPLMGGMSLFIQGKTSEPGIRRALRNDALPVLFDESESKNVSDEQRIQSVLGLMRGSSTETGAKTLMANANGGTDTYEIRSMFALVSIGIGLKDQADETRVSVLRLRNNRAKTDEEEAERALQWKNLQDMMGSFSNAFAERLLARTIGLIPTIRRNAEVFARVATTHFRSARLGDQYGHLLAGCYSLMTDAEVTEAKAAEFIGRFDWTSYIDGADETDELACLNSILQIMVPVDGRENRLNLTIGELAAIAARVAPEDENVGPRLADQHLSRYGIKVENGALYVANRSDALAKGLAGKGLLGANWHNLLSRIDGAEKVAPMWFAAGITQRAVKVPLIYVIKQNETPF